MPKAAPRATTPPKEFQEFWAAYPRKVGKRAALAAWKQTSSERPPTAILVERLEALRASGDWSEPQFIPYPATWLRRGGWDDDFTVARPPKAKPKEESELEKWKREQVLKEAGR